MKFNWVGVTLRSSSLRVGRGGQPITPSTNDISSNGGNGGWNGIVADLNSDIDLRDGLMVTNNAPNGILLRSGSRMMVRETTISGNADAGIRLQWASSAIITGLPVSVTGNALGLVCDDLESSAASAPNVSGAFNGIAGNSGANGNTGCSGF